MAKNPLHYQLSEYDCGPTAMLDAISYLFPREEIPPEIIRNIMLYFHQPAALPQILYRCIFTGGMHFVHAIGQHNPLNPMLRKGILVTAPKGFRQLSCQPQLLTGLLEALHHRRIHLGSIAMNVNLILKTSLGTTAIGLLG